MAYDPASKLDLPVLVLCGGDGTRLQSLGLDVPKPLAPIQGIPFCDYIVEKLKREGFSRIIFLVGRQHLLFAEYLQGSSVEHLTSQHKLGTGGAVKHAFEQLKLQRALVINGDTYFRYPLSRFARQATGLMDEGSLSVVVASILVDTDSEAGRLSVREDGCVEAWIRSRDKEMRLVNAGAYLVGETAFSELIEDSKFSLEDDVCKTLISSSLLGAAQIEGEFIDIGIPGTYQEAQALIPRWHQDDLT